MGWVVIGAGITATIALPIGSACTEAHEFNCGTGFAFGILILLCTAIVATILSVLAL